MRVLRQRGSAVKFRNSPPSSIVSQKGGPAQNMTTATICAGNRLRHARLQGTHRNGGVGRDPCPPNGEGHLRLILHKLDRKYSAPAVKWTTRPGERTCGLGSPAVLKVFSAADGRRRLLVEPASDPGPLSAWKNRLPYVPDGSFAEDASRIPLQPGIFARLRSFAVSGAPAPSFRASASRVGFA